MIMMRVCKYRECNEVLLEEHHGNREYCPRDVDQSYKMSCKAKEQKLIREKLDAERRDKYEKEVELNIQLKSILHGKNREFIVAKCFAERIEPIIDLFKKETVKGDCSNAVQYRFKEYSMCKVNLDGKYLIRITKNKSHE
jgi:hypothetical protein